MRHLHNKFILLGVLIFFLLLLFPFGGGFQKTTSQKVTPTVAKDSLSRTFYGKLPCDQICTEDEMTLTLTRNAVGQDEGTYHLLEQRIGQWNTPLEFTGNWTMAEGLDHDPKARIIVLDPEDEEIILGFYMISDDEIEVLDENGYRFDNPTEYRMKRQN